MLSCMSPYFLLLLRKVLAYFNDTKMEDLLSQNPLTDLLGLHRTMSSSSQPQLDDIQDKPRLERIVVDGEYLSYSFEAGDQRGMYIGAHPLTPEHNYYEIEVIDRGIEGTICLGLSSKRYPLDAAPGQLDDSVAYYIESGRLFKSQPTGTPFGPSCDVGDRIGCGIKFDHIAPGQSRLQDQSVPVFFTRNGKEIGVTQTRVPPGGLYPLLGMHSIGEEVRLITNIQFSPEEDTLMSVDSCEDEWFRLNDIRLNGPVLEYTGKGKSIIDVGLAQAKAPLNTTNHYFEIEILDPGENCYIAIGLTNRDFPKYRHPGWNKGSIGYHADDGKIFIGSGVGEPFGPRCHKGDRMGCGIYFPRDFVPLEETLSSHENTPDSPPEMFDLLGLMADTSDSEDEEWWAEGGGGGEPAESQATKVEVFFTRNSKTVGKKRVQIPRGGFYPTVGMLSIDEKVKVDLHPMTG